MRRTHRFLYRGVVRTNFAGEPDSEWPWRREPSISHSYYGPYTDAGQAKARITERVNSERDSQLYVVTGWVERLPCDDGKWERSIPEAWVPNEITHP